MSCKQEKIIYDIVPPGIKEQGKRKHFSFQFSSYVKGFMAGFLFLLLLITSFYALQFDSGFIVANSNSVYLADGQPAREASILPLSQKRGPQKSIVIDLKEMKLRTYHYGEFIAEYEVMGKGSPTHPTPKGKFEVLAKYDKAWSNNASAWMPWSIRFYKNYYIHEVPYYPSGYRLQSRYSGGCIRLSIGAAQEVYDFAEIGTPVIIK